MAAEAAQRHSERERATLQAWRDGDEEAFADLYRRYAPALRAYCRHRLGSVADAEDAAHETFVRAQASLARFDPDAPLWPWLVTIASHHCTDVLRKRGRDARMAALPAAAVAAAGAVVDLDVEEQVAGRLRASIARDALREVRVGYRAPLFLREFAGWSYAEIADSQGTTVGSVRSVLMRGRRELADRVRVVAEAQRAWPLPVGVGKSLEWARGEIHVVRDWVVRRAPALAPALDAAFVGVLALTAGSLVLSGGLGDAAATTTAGEAADAGQALSTLDPLAGTSAASPGEATGAAPFDPLATIGSDLASGLTVTTSPPWNPPGGTTYLIVDEGIPTNDAGVTGFVYVASYDHTTFMAWEYRSQVNGPVVGSRPDDLIVHHPCGLLGFTTLCTAARTVLQELPH
ncbi:MAG: sigma-70 family RNA polymerase sigma factor [Actinobacteria bacterium]|nr:sigma-70 family RNA polymerase sigma factor [Actinomycetota bacterium]